MAYSPPPVWSHGDVPTAALMNVYSDDLNTIYTALAGKKHIPAVRLRQFLSVDAGAVTTANSFFTIVHTWRWLFYGGSGSLTNYAGTERTTLPDATPGGTNIFDLESISWLNYGAILKINTVDWAFEDWEP